MYKIIAKQLKKIDSEAFGSFSFMDETVNKLQDSIQTQKMDKLISILKAYNIDFNNEIHNMFPRIKQVINHDRSESWYLDNNTKKGLLLITFNTPAFDVKSNPHSISVNVDYRL